MTYCSLAKELTGIKKFNQLIKIFNFYSTFTTANNSTKILSLSNVSKLKMRHNLNTNKSTKHKLKTNFKKIKNKKKTKVDPTHLGNNYSTMGRERKWDGANDVALHGA